MEAARAKVMGDLDRYKQIRPMLIEHRLDIETELRKKGKGMVPPPHVVMDKLIKMQDYKLQKPGFVNKRD